jgi:rhodanese-related sulfurtransferase
MDPDTAAIPQVTVDDLERALAAGGLVVDVRMPDEYEEAHVPGAVLIPLPELPDRAGEIPAVELVYVVCRSGARSQSACDFLGGLGVRTANVSGGTLAWIESGRPTVSGSERG